MLELNKMVRGAKEGNTPSVAAIIGMPFLFTFALSVGNVISEFIGAYLFQNIEQQIRISYMQYFQYGISFALAASVLIFFVCKVQGRPLRSIGFFKEKALFSYFKGVLIAFLGLVAIMSVLQFQGQLKVTIMPKVEEGHLAFLSIMIILAWVIQGASEELFLRGFMFQAITARYDTYKGIVIPAIVFAVLHLGNNGINSMSLINILLCGLALMLFVLKDANLWGACGFHTAWNLLQGNVFGIAVSGNTMPISLFKTTITEDTIWSGGTFGLEGSLLTTVFFIILSVIFIRQISKHNS